MKYFLIVSLFLFSQVAFADFFEIKTEKDSFLVEVTDANEINKLKGYNYAVTLSFTDKQLRIHNLNKDKIIDVIELP